MDQTQADKAPTPKGKADLIRDEILASDGELVAAWIETFFQVIEAQRVPTTEEFALRALQDDLYTRTRACMNQVGDMTIRVEPADLSFAGRTIYHSAVQDGSIPAALFAAGIRQLILREGMSAGELRGFVDVLITTTNGIEQCSDDAVTLLWDRAFKHIEYTCLPPDELVDRAAAAAQAGEALVSDEGIPWPMGMQQDADPDLRADESAGGRSDDWTVQNGDLPQWDESSRARLSLTDVESENLRMVAAIEEANSPETQLLEILSRILYAEEDPKAYLEIALIVGSLIEQAVTTGNLERASELVERLRTILASKATSQNEFREATDQVIRNIGRRDLLVRFGAALNSRKEVNFGALTGFLVQLGTAAAPMLCDLLGEIADMRMRRALCEALAISCKANVDLLIQRLNDPRWYVVRNLLYVLGRIGHQGVERALGEALYHNDVRVRREAVRALGGIDSATSRAYLNSALRDKDRTVRILVAQMVVKRVDERASQVLWSAIESPEFATRDADERTSFFVALGRAGSDALVPRLEKILTRGGLFRPGEQGSRNEAALALAWIGTASALAVLNREVKSVREEIRRAVELALESVRTASLKNKRPS